ncbi:MAG: succinate dehydrogenase assembly factor 2 [Rickettsiales bacterium]
MDKNLKLRKKIIYRSNYRGCKETDLIIGAFAKIHTPSMNEDELNELLLILDENDNFLYRCVTKKIELPFKYQSSKVFNNLIDFAKDYYK